LRARGIKTKAFRDPAGVQEEQQDQEELEEDFEQIEEETHTYY
jgi:hypothetical protein